jgi:hypothetical protein
MIIYNATTNSTQAATPMPQAISDYGMTMLNSECVLLCGGATNDTAVVSTCFLYLVGVDTWLTFPSLPTAIVDFPMITLHNRPFVFGGYNGNATLNTVLTFESNTWSERKPMEKALTDHRAVALNVDMALV